MTWQIARLKEPSTWRGLIWLLTALGVTLKPEVWEQITAVGMAVAGLIGVVTREEPTRVEIQLPQIELIGQSRVAESADPDADRPSAPERVRQPVPPDYTPKEPTAPVDLGQSGWNG